MWSLHAAYKVNRKVIPWNITRISWWNTLRNLVSSKLSNIDNFLYNDIFVLNPLSSWATMEWSPANTNSHRINFHERIFPWFPPVVCLMFSLHYDMESQSKVRRRKIHTLSLKKSMIIINSFFEDCFSVVKYKRVRFVRSVFMLLYHPK